LDGTLLVPDRQLYVRLERLNRGCIKLQRKLQTCGIIYK
jgi:hypothetical protein